MDYSIPSPRTVYAPLENHSASVERSKNIANIALCLVAGAGLLGLATIRKPIINAVKATASYATESLENVLQHRIKYLPNGNLQFAGREYEVRKMSGYTLWGTTKRANRNPDEDTQTLAGLLNKGNTSKYWNIPIAIGK